MVNEKILDIFAKVCVGVLLMLWFAFIACVTSWMVKRFGGYIYALYSIPFWLIGFVVLYKFFVKK